MKLIEKIKLTLRLIIKPQSILNKESYYPEEIHKNNTQILKDQLFFLWKYGDIEKFYYAYGFDRKSMSRERMCKEYIIHEHAFLQKIEYHNNHISKKIGRFSARCVVSDKFYFYLFLKSLGFPTPTILYYTRNGKLFYGIDDKTISNDNRIEKVFEKDLEGFAKPYGGQMGTGAFLLSISTVALILNIRIKLVH